MSKEYMSTHTAHATLHMKRISYTNLTAHDITFFSWTNGTYDHSFTITYNTTIKTTTIKNTRTTSTKTTSESYTTSIETIIGGRLTSAGGSTGENKYARIIYSSITRRYASLISSYTWNNVVHATNYFEFDNIRSATKKDSISRTINLYTEYYSGTDGYYKYFHFSSNKYSTESSKYTYSTLYG